MRIVEAYIARQIIRTSCLVLAIIAAALVLERTLRLLRDVDPAALPVKIAAAILLCKIPEILGIAVPFAFFAGILLTFQRLIRDRELDVLQAAGAGPASFIRPLAGLSAGVAALLLAVFWFLQPIGRYEVRTLMDAAVRAAMAAPLRTGAFLGFDGKVLHIQPHAGKASLFLYDADDQGRRFVTTAIADRLVLTVDDRILFMAAHDGRRVSIPHGDGRSTLLTVKSMRLAVHVATGGATEGRGGDASELTYPELLHSDPEPAVMAQIHVKLARVFAVLLLPLAAVSLALIFPVRRQWIAIAMGTAFVLALDQALIFAEVSTQRGMVSPWFAIWGAFLVFLAIAALLASSARLRLWHARPSPVGMS